MNGRFMPAPCACRERPLGPCVRSIRPTGSFNFFRSAASRCVHLAFVDFMIEARQVQHAVQDQDLHFRGQRVSEFGSILGGDFQRDGDVPRHTRSHRRKRQHVCGLVLFAEASIQRPHFAVRGNADVDLTRDTEFALYTGRKTA